MGGTLQRELCQVWSPAPARVPVLPLQEGPRSLRSI